MTRFYDFYHLQKDAVKSEDVPLEILRRSLNLVETKEEAREIEQKIQAINKVLYTYVCKVMSNFTGVLLSFGCGVPGSVQIFLCCLELTKTFFDFFFKKLCLTII